MEQLTTPAQQAKQHGFKSLKEMAELLNMSTQTLNNTFLANPVKFEALCIGSLAIRDKVGK